MNEARLTPGQPRPRCSASSNTLRRHRARVDLRLGLCVQQLHASPTRFGLRRVVRPTNHQTGRIAGVKVAAVNFTLAALISAGGVALGVVTALVLRGRHRRRAVAVVVLLTIVLVAALTPRPGPLVAYFKLTVVIVVCLLVISSASWIRKDSVERRRP